MCSPCDSMSLALGNQHYPSVRGRKKQIVAVSSCKTACAGVLEAAGGNYTDSLSPGPHPGRGPTTDYPGYFTRCA